MSQKFFKRKQLLQLLLSLFFLVMIVIPVRAGDGLYHQPRRLQDLSEGWQYRYGDSPINIQNIPVWIFDNDPKSLVWKDFSIPGQPPNNYKATSIWLRVKLPEVEMEKPGLLFSTNDQRFRVFFDGQLIYSYGYSQLEKEKAPGSPWHFIPVPANYQNKYLFFQMNSMFKRMTGLVRMSQFGTRSEAQRKIVLGSIDSFVLGCLFFFLSLILIIIYTGVKTIQRSFWALGFSSFCAGIWLISETDLRQILFDIPISTWIYWTIGSFYLMPVGLCAFVEEIFGGKYYVVLRRLWQTNVLFTLITFGLDLFNVVSLPNTLTIFYFFIVVITFCLVSVPLYEVFKGNPEAKIFSLGIFILGATGIYDILGWYYRIVPWSRYTSHWGLFVFFIILLFILRKHHLNMYWKLHNYSNEIEKKNRSLHKMWLEVKESRDQIAKWNKTLEERVIERTEQLAQANEELVLMLDTLKRTQNQLIQSEKMSALGNLVAGVAHEINTPIGISVTAVSHLAEKTAKIKEAYDNNQIKRFEIEKYLELSREMSKIVFVNLDRAANLIRSFKQVAVDQSSEVKRDFNVLTYINEVLLSLQPELKKTKHQIKVDCPGELVIKSYPGALSQIITNLVMNSLVHAFDEGENGLIAFTVSKDQTTLNLIYSDNGRGVSQENLEKIFNPFFTTMRGKGGTGLGLHIVHNIVTQTLQGTINCQSEPNQGTTFTIKFPV